MTKDFTNVIIARENVFPILFVKLEMKGKEALTSWQILFLSDVISKNFSIVSVFHLPEISEGPIVRQSVTRGRERDAEDDEEDVGHGQV